MSGAGDVYSASMPGMPQGSQIDYYVWATDGGGRASTDPANAPVGFYIALHHNELLCVRGRGSGRPGLDDRRCGRRRDHGRLDS